MEYASLEQLVAARCLDTLSEYLDKNAEISVTQQKEIRALVRDIYSAIKTAPNLLFASLHEPDIYRNRYNKSSEGKSELYGLIKRIATAIDNVIDSLLNIAKAAAVQEDGTFSVPTSIKIKKSHINIFDAVGISITKLKSGCTISPGIHSEAFEAISGLDITPQQLTWGVFSEPEKSVASIYRRNLGDTEAFDTLIGYLRENGYSCEVMREGELNLDYSKDYGKNPTPLKVAWGERNHGGMSFTYHRDVEPAFVSALRIPANKQLLAMADKMPESLRAFVVSRNTKCSGCRYCIQTDKTGTRPIIAINVEHAGKKYALCPNFPGFAFTFDKLDMTIVNNMIEYLHFIDENISGL